MRWRKTGMGAVLSASAIALSGCVVFAKAPTAKQKKSSVVITVKACASVTPSTPPGACSNQGNSGQNAASSPTKDQVWLGFRIPGSAAAPKSFVANTGPASGGPRLKFTVSKSYASQLQKNAPAPHGQKWVGYWTKYFSYSSSSGQQNFTAKPAFGLPKSFKGSFKYQVVVGGRANATGTPNPKQNVNCKGDLTKAQKNSGVTVGWICVDDSFSSSLSIH